MADGLPNNIQSVFAQKWEDISLSNQFYDISKYYLKLEPLKLHKIVQNNWLCPLPLAPLPLLIHLATHYQVTTCQIPHMIVCSNFKKYVKNYFWTLSTVFFFIRLPLEFLPASGPTDRWCASTLGTALLVSSRAGSDLGLLSRLVWGLILITHIQSSGSIVARYW